MAWASTDINPAAINLNCPFSYTANAVVNPVTLKLAPTNSANQKFDFTAAVGLTLDYLSAVNGMPLVGVTGAITPTMVAHDATGLTLSVTAAQLTSIANGLGSPNAQLTLQATDGTTPLDVAVGRINFNAVA